MDRFSPAPARARSTKTQVCGKCDENGFQWGRIGLGLGNGLGRNQVFRVCKTIFPPSTMMPPTDLPLSSSLPTNLPLAAARGKGSGRGRGKGKGHPHEVSFRCGGRRLFWPCGCWPLVTAYRPLASSSLSTAHRPLSSLLTVNWSPAFACYKLTEASAGPPKAAMRPTGYWPLTSGDW